METQVISILDVTPIKTPVRSESLLTLKDEASPVGLGDGALQRAPQLMLLDAVAKAAESVGPHHKTEKPRDELKSHELKHDRDDCKQVDEPLQDPDTSKQIEEAKQGHDQGQQIQEPKQDHDKGPQIQEPKQDHDKGPQIDEPKQDHDKGKQIAKPEQINPPKPVSVAEVPDVGEPAVTRDKPAAEACKSEDTPAAKKPKLIEVP